MASLYFVPHISHSTSWDGRSFYLVPELVPIAGQLDDAVVVALSLRLILKGAGTDTIKKNWHGPDESLKTLFKIARIEYP